MPRALLAALVMSAAACGSITAVSRDGGGGVGGGAGSGAGGAGEATTGAGGASNATTDAGGATTGAGGAGGAGGSTTGAGGAGGAGGVTTGTGGTGGATTGAGGSGGTAPTPAIKVEYDCTAGASAMNAAMFNLELVNQTATAVALGQVRVRYWLSVPLPTDQVVTCVSAQRGCDTVAVRAVALPTARPGANAYAEIAFSSSAGTLGGLANSGQIDISISDAESAPNNQTDDYSFDCSKAGTYVDAPKITAYIAGTLVWGTEP